MLVDGETHDKRARRAVDEIVRDRIAHERATKGTLFPDVRAHEKAAQEIARRADRKRLERDGHEG